MTTLPRSSSNPITSTLTLLLLLGQAALGCATEVGDAPLDDAPYDDDLVAPYDDEEEGVSATPQALEPDRDGAYVLSQSATASHVVTASTYNSKGGENYVERAALGRYNVHLQRLEKADGNVQVVAYGSDSIRCKVNGWPATSTRYPGSLAVSVRCHNVAGNPADSRFVMTFVGKRLRPEYTPSFGFAWSSSATASHTANSRFSDVEGGRSIPITRLEKGRYRVRFQTEEQSDTGFPQVTAYGPLAEYCTIANTALPPGVYGVDVSVDCFDTTGARADSLFSLLWTSYGLFDYASLASVYANQETTEEYEPSHQTGLPYFSVMTVYRSGTGQYSYEPLEINPRVALATARANNGRYCKLFSRSSTSVSVRCYDEDGNRADTRYYSTAFEAP